MSRHRPHKPTVRDSLSHLLSTPVVWPVGVNTVVCVAADTRSPFGDDVLAPCASGGVIVCHRPSIPPHVTKLCPTCALRQVEGGAA